jgi:hypothetical protein
LDHGLARYHGTGSALRYALGLNLEIEKLYVRLDVTNIPPPHFAHTQIRKCLKMMLQLLPASADDDEGQPKFTLGLHAV